MVIEEKKVVLVHYTLTEENAEGQLIESTKGGEPLGFIQGIGMMIPAFEENMEGLKAGDSFSFGIKASDAYGEYDDSALMEAPMSMFEEEFEQGQTPEGLLEIGNIISLNDAEGNHYRATVARVEQNTITLDFNHPLSGVDLYFTGEVVAVRDAQPEELEHGHVHGEGGHRH